MPVGDMVDIPGRAEGLLPAPCDLTSVAFQADRSTILVALDSALGVGTVGGWSGPLARVIALVGAGGKTTTMFALAAELANQGRQVLVTSTTHIHPPKPEQVDRWAMVDDLSQALHLIAARPRLERLLCLTGPLDAAGKCVGVPSAWVDWWALQGLADVILVEADGARGRLLKAPDEHEPALPRTCGLLLAMASFAALGRTVSGEIVHRMGQFCQITGLAEGEAIDCESMVRLARHPHGLAKAARCPVLLALSAVDQNGFPQAVDLARQIVTRAGFRGALLIGRQGSWGISRQLWPDSGD